MDRALILQALIDYRDMPWTDFAAKYPDCPWDCSPHGSEDRDVLRWLADLAEKAL